jgi:hypothetical protein
VEPVLPVDVHRAAVAGLGERAYGLLDESRGQRLAGARTVIKRLAAMDALTDAVS